MGNITVSKRSHSRVQVGQEPEAQGVWTMSESTELESGKLSPSMIFMWCSWTCWTPLLSVDQLFGHLSPLSVTYSNSNSIDERKTKWVDTEKNLPSLIQPPNPQRTELKPMPGGTTQSISIQTDTTVTGSFDELEWFQKHLHSGGCHFQTVVIVIFLSLPRMRCPSLLMNYRYILYSQGSGLETISCLSKWKFQRLWLLNLRKFWCLKFKRRHVLSLSLLCAKYISQALTL